MALPPKRSTAGRLQGQITDGTAQNLLHPGSTATWTATGPADCADQAAAPSCNVAGSWTLFLQNGNYQPVLALTQTGTTIGITVTSDPGMFGTNVTGNSYSGSISGSTITLNLPWNPNAGGTPSAPQPYVGTVSASQIEDTIALRAGP